MAAPCERGRAERGEQSGAKLSGEGGAGDDLRTGGGLCNRREGRRPGTHLGEQRTEDSREGDE
jgi:hypothetical protein